MIACGQYMVATLLVEIVVLKNRLNRVSFYFKLFVEIQILAAFYARTWWEKETFKVDGTSLAGTRYYKAKPCVLVKAFE